MSHPKKLQIHNIFSLENQFLVSFGKKLRSPSLFRGVLPLTPTTPGSWLSSAVEPHSKREGANKVVLQFKNPSSFVGQDRSSGKKQAHFLPTCNLIFYLPLHMQRLHINGSVSNEPRTSDPPVGLAETVLFILVPETDHKTQKGETFRMRLRNKTSPRGGGTCIMSGRREGLAGFVDSFWVTLPGSGAHVPLAPVIRDYLGPRQRGGHGLCDRKGFPHCCR